MSRPAWMTDELEEEWVEPEWDGAEDQGAWETSRRSRGSRRSIRETKVQRSPHLYGSVRVASSSPGSASDAGASMRERSVRDLLELSEGEKHKDERPASATLSSIPDASPAVGTFLVREDVPPEPLKVSTIFVAGANA